MQAIDHLREENGVLRGRFAGRRVRLNSPAFTERTRVQGLIRLEFTYGHGVSIASDIFGGLTTDWAVSRFGMRRGRCGVGAIAYLIAGAALIVAAASGSPLLAAIMIELGTAASMFTLGTAWSTAIELGRDHAGVVSAAMNTSGQFGSLLCPLIVAYSVEWIKSWDLPLYLMGGLFLLGVVCWVLIDIQRPIFGTEGKGS